MKTRLGYRIAAFLSLAAVLTTAPASAQNAKVLRALGKFTPSSLQKGADLAAGSTLEVGEGIVLLQMDKPCAYVVIVPRLTKWSVDSGGECPKKSDVPKLADLLSRSGTIQRVPISFFSSAGSRGSEPQPAFETSTPKPFGVDDLLGQLDADSSKLTTRFSNATRRDSIRKAIADARRTAESALAEDNANLQKTGSVFAAIPQVALTRVDAKGLQWFSITNWSVYDPALFDPAQAQQWPDRFGRAQLSINSVDGTPVYGYALDKAETLSNLWAPSGLPAFYVELIDRQTSDTVRSATVFRSGGTAEERRQQGAMRHATAVRRAQDRLRRRSDPNNPLNVRLTVTPQIELTQVDSRGIQLFRVRNRADYDPRIFANDRIDVAVYKADGKRLYRTTLDIPDRLDWLDLIIPQGLGPVRAFYIQLIDRLTSDVVTSNVLSMNPSPPTGLSARAAPRGASGTLVRSFTARGGAVPDGKRSGATFEIRVDDARRIAASGDNVTLTLAGVDHGAVVDLAVRLEHVGYGDPQWVFDRVLNQGGFICAARMVGTFVFTSSSNNLLRTQCGSGGVQAQPTQISGGTFRTTLPNDEENSRMSSAWNGQPAAGVWRLIVQDLNVNTAGRFMNPNWTWRLDIRFAN